MDLDVRFGLSVRLRKFRKLVSGANHRPLAFDSIERAEQELSEFPNLLDLTEPPLNDLLSGATAAAAPSPLQAESRRAHQEQLRQYLATCRICLVMTRPPRSKVALMP